MSSQGIILVGGPDSGKTNYIARLWAALRSGTGALKAATTPKEVRYVEAALAYLLQGEFAPRTELGLDTNSTEFVIPTILSNGTSSDPTDIIVPDVSGELWKTAVETNELEKTWMDKLESADGAVLFVRIGSDQNVEPLDWVTSAALMKMQLQAAAEHPISTQLSLCQLVKFLEQRLGKKTGSKPRVALLITAWDRLDAERRAAGPRAYIEREFPLLSGRLKYGDRLAMKVFGVSVVGGDFIDAEFTDQFLNGDLLTSGYVVHENGVKVDEVTDVSLPIAWIVDGEA